MNSPIAAAQPQSHIGDLSTSAGYEVLVRKLRLLKYERAGACQKNVTCTKFCPRPQTLVESLEAIARAAYARHARKTQDVQRLLNIPTPTETPAMSRSSSYASSADSVESLSSAPITIEVYSGKPRMEYECLQDEWMEAEKWVNDLVDEDEDF